MALFSDLEIRVGDIWLLPYDRQITRMRVSRVTQERQIVLVEAEPPPERFWIRTLVVSQQQLPKLGTPDG